MTKQEIIEFAAHRTNEYRQRWFVMKEKKDGFGFHCSESSIRAINDALNMHIPEDVIRISTGFRGGGGGYGDRCGILESGIILLGFKYGRLKKEEDCTKISYLVRLLHERYMNELGSIYCRILFPFHRLHSKDDSCAYVYDMGTRIVAKLLLEAEDLLLEMPKNEIC